MTRRVDALAVGALISETSRQSNVAQREILRELRQGKTLTEIATANKADPAKIVQAALTTLTDQINNQVKNNKLTQEQATKIIGELPTTLNNIMTEKNPLKSELRGK